MSVMSNTGGAYLASLLFSETFWLAWGSGVSWWDSNQSEVFQFTANSKTLARAPISSVVIKSLDDVTTYALTTDYTVNLTTGVLTRNPAGAMANTTDYRAYYFAHRPTPLASASALNAALGLLETQNKQYVTPNNSTGLIVTGAGEKWDNSGSPTPYIYLEAAFDFADEPSATIKELGVYIDSTFSGSPPPEQTYFPNAGISSIGQLLNIEYITPIVRSGSQNGVFKTVLRFVN